MELQTQLRNGTLPDLVEMLKAQNDVKYDVVVPAERLRYENGNLHISDGAVRFDDEGVTMIDAVLAPTEVFHDAIADRLSIPRAYYRRMQAERVDMLDYNVNGWLRGEPRVRDIEMEDEVNGGTMAGKETYFINPDTRTFLVRGFRTDDPDDIGIARALLSDRFRMGLDNYDTLFGVLEGIRDAGVEVNIVGAELSERRMRVKVQAPQVQALAPELLKNYRSPFDGASPERREAMLRHGYIEPGEQPVVFAGFEFGNSETGGGAWTIVPRIVVQACTNGLLMTMDGLREVHLGGKLDEGVVRWSSDTMQKSIELVKAKTVDAVRTFLDVEYVKDAIVRLEAKSARKVDEPIPAIQRLAKQQQWTEDEANAVLTFFLQGGQQTAGGVMQAVTAVAQTVSSPDRAYELEASAVALLDASFN